MKIHVIAEIGYRPEAPYASDRRVEITVTDSRATPPTVGAIQAATKLAVETLKALRS